MSRSVTGGFFAGKKGTVGEERYVCARGEPSIFLGELI